MENSLQKQSILVVKTLQVQLLILPHEAIQIEKALSTPEKQFQL